MGSPIARSQAGSCRMCLISTLTLYIIFRGCCATTQHRNITITVPSPRRVLPPTTPSYVAICVVAKDVHPDDAVEWIVHHIRIGVGHIYWYDHNSTVDLSRTIAPFEQAGLLTRLQPSADPGFRIQVPVYHHCGDTYGHLHEWLAYIDADEMLWLPGAQTNLKEQPLVTVLKEYEAYAGLAVNWITYGSSGHLTRPHDTTLRAYSKCISSRPGHQAHVKTIVHTAHLSTPFRFYNPHSGHFEHDKIPVESDHEQRVEAQKQPVVDELFRTLPEPHLTEDTTVQRIALLHFITRSKEESEAKVARGAADGTRKSMAFMEQMENMSTSNCSLVIDDTQAR